MNNKQAKRLRKLINSSTSPSADPLTQRTRYQKLKSDFKRTPAPHRAKLLKHLDKAVSIMRGTDGATQTPAQTPIGHVEMIKPTQSTQVSS